MKKEITPVKLKKPIVWDPVLALTLEAIIWGGKENIPPIIKRRIFNQ